VRTEQYGYDELHRLTGVNYGDGETQGYTCNAANMLLSRGSDLYQNDANGNTLTGGGRANTWDGQNRLTQCVKGGVTSIFTNGADELRRRKVTGGNTIRNPFRWVDILHLTSGAQPAAGRTAWLAVRAVNASKREQASTDSDRVAAQLRRAARLPT